MPKPVNGINGKINAIIPPYLIHAPIGILLSRNLTILWANDQLLEMLNYNSSELANSPLSQIFPDRLQNLIEDSTLERETGKILIKQYETFLLTKNGMEVPTYLQVDIAEFEGKTTSIWFITDLTELRASQKAKREADKKYQEVVELQTDLIVRWKPDGTRTFVNDVYCEYFGITKEQAIGTSIFDVTQPEIEESIKGQMKLFSPTNPSFKIDRRSVLKNGEIRWNQWIGTASFDSNGEIDEIQSIGRDITQIKESEELAKRNEQYFRNLFEHSPNATIVHDFSQIKFLYDQNQLESVEDLNKLLGNNSNEKTDCTFPFKRVAVNSAYCELFKIQDPNDFLTAPMDLTFLDETYEAYKRSLIELLKGKTRITFNTTHVTLEGKAVPVIVKRSIDLNTKIPWERIYTTIIDITDLLETQRKVEINERKYRTLFETAQEAIYLLDPQTLEIIDCNPLGSGMFGYKKEEIIGQKINMIIDYGKELLNLDQISLSDKPVIVNMTAICKDSTELTIESSLKMMNVDNREVLLNLVRDISVRIKSESELQEIRTKLHEAQKMEAIGRMSGGIAHDFNNLLTMINLNTEFLAEEIPEESELHNIVKEILTSVKKATVITSELLLFSKNRVMNPEIIEINSFMSHFCKSYLPLIPETVIFEYSTLENDVFVKCDPLLLEQVFMNVCNNALDAMNSEGRLQISLKVLKDHVHLYEGIQYRKDTLVIKIVDSGPGVSDDVKSKMFEPFFTTKDGKGTGLGLANAYHIIRQFEGYIDVFNLDEGGFSFEIYLPESDPKMDADNSKNLKKRGRKKSSARVLVVDDDENIRLILKKILQANQIEVIEAKDGSEGFKQFESNAKDIDLIITDIRMPIMNGQEFISKVRKKNSKIPVIYVTGFTQNLNEIAKFKQDNERIIQKPFHLEHLLDEVKALVGLEIEFNQ